MTNIKHSDIQIIMDRHKPEDRVQIAQALLKEARICIANAPIAGDDFDSLELIDRSLLDIHRAQHNIEKIKVMQ